MTSFSPKSDATLSFPVAGAALRRASRSLASWPTAATALRKTAKLAEDPDRFFLDLMARRIANRGSSSTPARNAAGQDGRAPDAKKAPKSSAVVKDESWIPSGVNIRDPDSERRRFARVVERRRAEGRPILVHCGVGRNPKPDFLNLDIKVHEPAKAFIKQNPDSMFVFPFADMSWELPDGSVDYVFHEDFIEHIPQKLQIMFLAETYRVMKAGAWHRVNTPCLIQSMKTHCDFSKGSAGVYQREWDRWGHQVLFSQQFLEEIAKTIGYREVVFNGKNMSVSPYRTSETRPGNDRDQLVGNVFADLLK